ncbi:MAG: hypothetical protein SF029_01075 [bacterium]|nr:hypothetical protein [bacterium]
MLRTLLNLTAGLILVTTALILLTLPLAERSRAIARQQLDSLLVTAGCEAPCFMGIRPGVTTLAEARALLEAHPWVGGIEPGGFPATFSLSWRWSGQQPESINAAGVGTIVLMPTGGSLDESTVVVNGIYLTTTMPLHQWVGAFGVPYESQQDVFMWYEDTQMMFNAVFYPANARLTTIASVPCGATRTDLFHVPMTLSLEAVTRIPSPAFASTRDFLRQLRPC